MAAGTVFLALLLIITAGAGVVLAAFFAGRRFAGKNFAGKNFARKDRGGRRGILTAGICLAAVLLVPAVSFFLDSAPAAEGGAGVTSISVSDYLGQMEDRQGREWVSQWLAECAEELDKAYMLRREEEKEDGERQVCYLVYLPRLSEGAGIGVGVSSGWLGVTVTVDCAASEGGMGNQLLLVTWTGEESQRAEWGISFFWSPGPVRKRRN